MALVRCKDHKPQGNKYEYIEALEPVGFPETAAICGLKHCEQAGLVWLTKDEYDAYQEGQRIFEIPTAAAKLRVT